MKGGITSGVVYPSAVQKLSNVYRFRNIGGASAGAIAAAITAAAEYGRRNGKGGFGSTLDDVNKEIQTEGFLLSLFQPAPGVRSLFDGAMAILKHRQKAGTASGGSPEGPSILSTILRIVPFIWRQQPLVSLLALVVLIGFLLTVTLTTGGAWGVVAVVLSIALVLAGVAFVTLGEAFLILRGAYKAINGNDFGICSGLAVRPSSGPGFTEWLDRKIQSCAGRGPDDPPLTFKDLQGPPEGPPINLNLVTTDLNFSRPVILPLQDRKYLFRKDDMAKLFPPRVVDFMWAKGGDPGDLDLSDGGAGTYRYLPTDELPILVAFRMSLSFPVLISGVRLSSYDEQTHGVIEHWFSDGGISSNFPIHFFDSLLPGRPTFALDLQPYPKESDSSWRMSHKPEGGRDVHMPSSPEAPRRPRWAPVHTLGGFLSQIVDAFENWRDNMQAELPGFRDRICEIYLAPDEGGLNLAMPKPTIERLMQKGEEAADEVLRVFTFNPHHWDEHRFTRYLTAMQMLQMRLKEASERFPGFATFLDKGAPGVEVYREGHDARWCADAAAATTAFLSIPQAWGQPGFVNFWMGEGGGDNGKPGDRVEPEPTATMRIVPNV